MAQVTYQTPVSFVNVSFRKVKRVAVSREPSQRRKVAIVGVGNYGIKQALRSLQIKKETKEQAGVAILAHADADFLSKEVKRASKFIPINRIFPIQINMLNGIGNGKRLKRCIKNFPNWRPEVENQISKIVEEINNQGSWVLEAYTSSGGSCPVLVYFLEVAKRYFDAKFVFVGEPRDSASQKNLNELLFRLSGFDDTFKIVFLKNTESDDTKEQIRDWSNAGIANTMTTGCGSDGWDVVDFLENMPDDTDSNTCKFVEVATEVQAIPYKSVMLFWHTQEHEKSLRAVKSLFESLECKNGEMCFVVGKVSDEVAKLGMENAYPIDTPILHKKKIGVKIETWNVVGGKAKGFVSQKVPTPNFDRLKEMMEGKDEKNRE